MHTDHDQWWKQKDAAEAKLPNPDATNTTNCLTTCARITSGTKGNQNNSCSPIVWYLDGKHHEVNKSLS